MTAPNLKPCPFCGGTMEDRGYGAIHASAGSCPIQDLAIDVVRWNRRADLNTATARIAELETLLARSLVFDHGSAEDGLDALGGWGCMCDLVTAYREATPLPTSDMGNPISESATGIDGDVAF